MLSFKEFKEIAANELQGLSDEEILAVYNNLDSKLDKLADFAFDMWLQKINSMS